MLIALLAVLGVDLAILAVVVAVLLSRRARVRHQRGAFKGMIRVAEGEVPGPYTHAAARLWNRPGRVSNRQRGVGSALDVRREHRPPAPAVRRLFCFIPGG